MPSRGSSSAIASDCGRWWSCAWTGMLRGRLDASAVLQDANLDLASRVDEYVREPKLPPFLWLRLVVGERLINLHRHHLGAQMRDPAREVSLYRGAMPEASSAALAARLLGRYTSPS